MWTDDGPTTWCPPYKAWVTRPVDMMTHAEEQREKIKQSHTQVPVSLFAISWHTKLVVLVSASPPPPPLPPPPPPPPLISEVFQENNRCSLGWLSSSQIKLQSYLSIQTLRQNND